MCTWGQIVLGLALGGFVVYGCHGKMKHNFDVYREDLYPTLDEKGELKIRYIDDPDN